MLQQSSVCYSYCCVFYLSSVWFCFLSIFGKLIYKEHVIINLNNYCLKSDGLCIKILFAKSANYFAVLDFYSIIYTETIIHCNTCVCIMHKLFRFNSKLKICFFINIYIISLARFFSICFIRFTHYSIQ